MTSAEPCTKPTRFRSRVFAAATKELGRQGVVELIGILGYYTFVSMTLNAFEIGLPEGEKPELRFVMAKGLV